MSEIKLPAFDSIKSQLFPFVHDQLSLVHPWTAEKCVQILKNSRFTGSEDPIVHVGAGFGGDMQFAYVYGFRNRIGLDKDPTQVELAEFLRTASQEQLLEYLEADQVVRSLYPTALRQQVAKEYCVKRAGYDPNPLNLKVCDVRSKFSLHQTLGRYGEMFYGMIGSIMMHWLVQDGFPLRDALDVLGGLLYPGSIAVLNAPFHFTELENAEEDEMLRSECLPDTDFYHVFTETVVGRLKQKFGDVPSMSFRKVPSLLMKEADIKAGSDLMELVEIKRYWTEQIAPIDIAMTGLGAYESALRARQPIKEVVPFVMEGIARASEKVGTHEDAGTYMTFYVFRRK